MVVRAAGQHLLPMLCTLVESQPLAAVKRPLPGSLLSIRRRLSSMILRDLDKASSELVPLLSKYQLSLTFTH